MQYFGRTVGPASDARPVFAVCTSEAVQKRPALQTACLICPPQVETETGLYELDGLGYNGYFLFESKSPDGFTKDDRYFYFQI